jgi:8-oxo-dGTP pyrophosphatase MutT (NUDIX family)
MDLVVSGCCFLDDEILLVYHRKLDVWLPPGGHIDRDETPDAAVRRELKEEVGIDVELVQTPSITTAGSVREELATPFYVNVHDVGDHDHCCFFYLCTTKTRELDMAPREVRGARWLSRDEVGELDAMLNDTRMIVDAAFDAWQDVSE